MKFFLKKFIFFFLFFFPTLFKPNIKIWRLFILFFPPHFWRLKSSKVTSFSILFLISFFGEIRRWLGWDSRNPCVAGAPACVRACVLARVLPLQSSARRSTRTRRRRRKGKEKENNNNYKGSSCYSAMGCCTGVVSPSVQACRCRTTAGTSSTSTTTSSCCTNRSLRQLRPPWSTRPPPLLSLQFSSSSSSQSVVTTTSSMRSSSSAESSYSELPAPVVKQRFSRFSFPFFHLPSYLLKGLVVEDEEEICC